MKCSEFMQLLDAWTDGELSEEQRAEMERHAIRAEARLRLMKRIYGAVSAVAAVAVVAFCVTALLPGRQKADPAPETTGVEYAVLQSAPRAYVEADGLSEEAQL